MRRVDDQPVIGWCWECEGDVVVGQRYIEDSEDRMYHASCAPETEPSTIDALAEPTEGAQP